MRQADVKAGALLIVVGMALGSGFSELEAQVIEPPPRSTPASAPRREVSPTRTAQELTLTIHVLGGYEDNLGPEGQGLSTDPLRAPEPGYLGLAAGSLRYWRGHARRSLEASGRTQVTSYSHLIGPLTGGDGHIRGTTLVGERTHLHGSVHAQYLPTFTVGPPTSAVDPDQQPAPGDVSQGVREVRSFSAGGSGGISRDWSPRQRTASSYDRAHHRFLDAIGVDSVIQSAALFHTWEFQRSAGTRMTYRYMDQDSADGSDTDAVPERPLRSHSLEIGLDLRKRFSRTRQLSISLGGGATRVLTHAQDGQPLDYTTPSGFGSIRIDLGRTWSLSGDFRRDVSMIVGFTDRSFETYTGSIRTGGQVSERVQLALAGTYSSGVAPIETQGSYRSGTAGVQVNYRLTRWASLHSSYTYYNHHLADTIEIPEGLPRMFERNSVRLGVTFTFPLQGGTGVTAGRPGRRTR